MRMIVTPVSGSPARMARSTGAAPRQRGSSDRCRFSRPSGAARSTGAGRSWPNAATTPASTPAARRSSVTSRARFGVRTGRSSSPAAAWTGLGWVAAPRLRRRSGWVTTRATSWPASCTARSTGTAVAGVPKKATRTRRRSEPVVAARARGAVERAGPQLAQRLLAGVGLEPVDDEHAVEVVDLVLDEAAHELVTLEDHLVAVEVEAPHRHHLR